MNAIDNSVIAAKTVRIVVVGNSGTAGVGDGERLCDGVAVGLLAAVGFEVGAAVAVAVAGAVGAAVGAVVGVGVGVVVEPVTVKVLVARFPFVLIAVTL